MSDNDFDVSALPEEHRTGVAGFAKHLAELAGENLLGLSAFGGWIAEDPLYHAAPARCVAVLRRVDLDMLDVLAHEGERLGRRHIAAPLIMTPEYIRDSRDVFPLELLEIQQLHALVHGRDYFADLSFDRAHVRLQCERELKSELMQMRQDLLAAAGRHKMLLDALLAAAERTVRVLRGVLFLAGVEEVPELAHALAGRGAETAGAALPMLRGVLGGEMHSGMDEYRRFYREIEALTAYVDGLPD